MQLRLRKFERQPAAFTNRRLTQRSLDILATIARYRLIPTSLIVPLVGGDARTTHDHLQMLFHRNFVARFPLRFVGSSEVCYYLDNIEALSLLAERPGTDPQDLGWDEVRRNRDNPFDGIRRSLFVQHELMISRFHAMLELACRRSTGAVELATWRQGPKLRNTVEMDRLAYDGERDTWYREEGTERLPHEPDAFFTLRYAQLPEGERELSFFYEADRKTTTKAERIRDKFRAHFHFVVRDREKLRRTYQVDRIRAVLIETLDRAWAQRLREAARHSVVSGGKPSSLFWFTTSEVFTLPGTIQEGRQAKTVPRFLVRPEIIFNPIWISPVDNTRYSLLQP